VSDPPKNEVFRPQFCRQGAQAAETSKQRVWTKVGPNCQVSSKSVNRKWVNGRGHRTNRQTDRHAKW